MKLTRWDTGAVIREDDGDVRATVEACARLGISMFRANLTGDSSVEADITRADFTGANLDGASFDDASLTGANFDEANLDGASFVDASLAGANFDGASFDGANLPIWCKWHVSYITRSELDPIVTIGRYPKTVREWDTWFSGTETFDFPRDSEDFRRIRANYLAMRAYLVAMGLHTEAT